MQVIGRLWSMGRRLGRVQVPLERCPYTTAPPVQQYSLISAGDVQNVTDLFRGPTLDVAQGNDLALGRRQGRNRLRHDVEGLLREESCFGRLPPAARRRAPMKRRHRIVCPAKP